DATGVVNGYVRLKPDRPRLSKKDGKPVKYESPKGSGNRAFFPTGTIPALADPSIGLLIVEGEKKSLAANQHGFPCVGLVGVYGWQRKRPKGADGKAEGPRELIADLEAATWPGRPVFVVFDSDVAINKDVGLAEYHLALTLRRHGARAFAVRLPAGP